MRYPRVRFTVRRMMVVIAVMAVVTWAYARSSGGWWYYAVGWWEAERELWRGGVTIYGGGGHLMGEFVDQETCLPIECVSGCNPCTGDYERIQGHNDHIHQYIRWNGLPENSLKRWASGLFNLRKFFDDCARVDQPKRLVGGGATLVSPDGRNCVQALKPPTGEDDQSLEVAIHAGRQVLYTWNIGNDAGDSDLVWGPQGSRLALIRSAGAKTERYEAIDLRTGLLLRTEWFFEGKTMRELLESLPEK